MKNDHAIRLIVRKMIEEELNEMTTTGDIAGYNIPAAFSGNSPRNARRKKAIATLLGMKLTKRGKKDLSRGADKLEHVTESAKDDDDSTWSDFTPKFGTHGKRFGKDDDTGMDIPKKRKTNPKSPKSGAGAAAIPTPSKLDEAKMRYHEYKNDESATSSQKIARAVTEINHMLNEMERTVRMNSRLQQESGIAGEALYRRTQQGLLKLEARLLALAGKVRNIRGT
jgi:hypothetical protein